MNRFRFNLTTLLLLTGVISICFGYLSQSGFEAAFFEIKSNELLLDEEGIVRGDLVCECALSGEEPTRMICRVEQSLDASLVKLAVTKVIRVRYRRWPPLGLFDKQDPYGMFLTSKLGIAADDIVGQIKLYDESIVIVRQKLRRSDQSDQRSMPRSRFRWIRNAATMPSMDSRGTSPPEEKAS